MGEFTSFIKQSTLMHLCFAISFFTSGLIINILQCILYVFLRPFSKYLYRKIGYYLCYSFYCQLVFVADWWSNSTLNIYISDEDLKGAGKEHVLLLMNHSYEVDWLVGWMFCEKVGVLGNCKAYAKKVIQYIPTIGWSWKFAEFVFLERSFERDRDIISKQINEIMDYPDPVFLLLNAEGTRFTQKKHEASIQFAKERGMTELKHHLIPRTKGFTSSLPALREKCPAILDIQLAFKHDATVKPTIFNLLNGRGVTGYMHVRRIATKSIPEKEEEAAEWLQQLFREKDLMQESFHKYGNFFTGSNQPEKPVLIQPPRISSLLNTAGWTFATVIPMMYYLIKLFTSGQIFYFTIGVLILVAFYILLVKSIGMSKISKASDYGSSVNEHGSNRSSPTTPVKESAKTE